MERPRGTPKLLTEGDRWGLATKSVGDRRNGKMIPGSEQVATDLGLRERSLRSKADQRNCQKPLE